MERNKRPYSSPFLIRTLCHINQPLHACYCTIKMEIFCEIENCCNYCIFSRLSPWKRKLSVAILFVVYALQFTITVTIINISELSDFFHFLCTTFKKYLIGRDIAQWKFTGVKWIQCTKNNQKMKWATERLTLVLPDVPSKLERYMLWTPLIFYSFFHHL